MSEAFTHVSECMSRFDKSAILFGEAKRSLASDDSKDDDGDNDVDDEPPTKRQKLMSDSRSSCRSVGLSQHQKNKWQAVGVYLIAVLSVKHLNPIACLLTSFSNKERAQIVFYSNPNKVKKNENENDNNNNNNNNNNNKLGFIKMVEIGADLQAKIIESVVKTGSIEIYFPDIDIHPFQTKGHSSILSRSVLHLKFLLLGRIFFCIWEWCIFMF